jgi:GNAT superfamily N-acetyltransferase
MRDERIIVYRVDGKQHEGFYHLHSKANEADWCYCMAWWTSTWSEFAERSSEQNRSLREELFAAGQNDGYLLYINDEVAAWCQCGVRDRLPKLLETYALEPESETFAFTCFLVTKKWRGRGVAHQLLCRSLEDLTARGVNRVQAYPRRGVLLTDDDAWQGTERLFQRAGFELIRDHESWPIYQLDLSTD